MEFHLQFLFGLLTALLSVSVDCDDSKESKRAKPLPFRFGKRGSVEEGVGVDGDRRLVLNELEKRALPFRFGKRGKVIPFRFGKRDQPDVGDEILEFESSELGTDKRTPRIPLRFGKRNSLQSRMDPDSDDVYDSNRDDGDVAAFLYNDDDEIDAGAITDALKRAIPFRFGKRAPIPFRFGKRAIPFRFG